MQDTKDISWRVLAKVPPKDRKSTGELTKVFSLQEMEEALDRQQVAHQQEISLAVAEALNDLERSHEIRFMEVQREHEHQVSELIRDHNDKIRELGKQYEDTRREREAKHEEIVKQLQKLHAVAAEVRCGLAVFAASTRLQVLLDNNGMLCSTGPPKSTTAGLASTGSVIQVAGMLSLSQRYQFRSTCGGTVVIRRCSSG